MTANTNGFHVHRPLKAGIWAPIPTFFLPHAEELDLAAFESHVLRVASAGVGPLLAGSMGEAIHLSPQERVILIRTARNVLDNAGLNSVPLVVGTGAASTRETLKLTADAAAAGADYAIVIASGYYAGALGPAALKAFFTEVAEKSAIPIFIYNYPGASGGIDLDSDLISELAAESPNICGVKLTCGNVGKLTRIADTVSSYSRENPFLVLGGFIDFLTPSTFAHGAGAITGLANLSPHAIRKLFDLSEAAKYDLTVLPEAQRLQGIIARADYTIAKTGIAGTKFLLERLYGYGGAPRRPLLPTPPDAGEALWQHPHTQALVAIERELSGKK
ncbi:Dihydrodipicolinate synthetase [Mycena chlorophos]|uniref:Dihydrodipicolinate synthetase n=1 Tax=Mycena chlorophos TaxID=658473 RepID=A0A8H6TS82_MYCCL|nr:Dihydrodipicolinate synthetase [Mycena chlorophos]